MHVRNTHAIFSVSWRYAALFSTALFLLAPSTQLQAQNVLVYDNTTTPTGTFSNGGANDNNAGPGVAITKLVADDIHVATSVAGMSVSNYGVFIANNDPTAFSARVRIRFWLADGPSGGPGTFVTGVTFDPITFAPNSQQFVFGTLRLGLFVLPANGLFWAGVTFDNGTSIAPDGITPLPSSATTAQLNKLGEGLYDPPTIGSSTDEAFSTTSAGSFFGVNNPSGTIFVSPFAGNPVANIGWQFQVYAVPEPSTYLSLALGGALLVFGAKRRGRLRK